MSQIDPLSQKAYWEEAGRQGYLLYMYSAGEVERHVTTRLRPMAVDIGRALGLGRNSSVLELGCGDGSFANEYLAQNFGQIRAVDFSEAAIARARAESKGSGTRFETFDLTRQDINDLGHYDGAFLFGILHHVKAATPGLLAKLAKMAPRVVVQEPNGDNLLRKALEFSPSYRAAGEDSFRTWELVRIFEAAGFKLVVWKRCNLFPIYTPGLLFRLLRPIEPFVESMPLLRAMCNVNMFGFVAKSLKLRGG
jgi:SAM-dependent methyltransferase